MKMRYALLLVLIVLVAAAYFGGDYLTIENLKESRDGLLQSVDNNYLIATVLFIVLYILVVALSIPGATVMTLAGGLMFGAIVGTIYVNIGATIGAVIVFLLARYLFGEKLQKKYHKQLKTVNKEIVKNGLNYMLTLRFIPLFPFFAINAIAGLTKVPLRTYVWTTSLGIIPGSFAYAFAGSRLSTIESLKDIISPGMIMAFVLLGLVALLPIILKKVKKDEKI